MDFPFFGGSLPAHHLSLGIAAGSFRTWQDRLLVLNAPFFPQGQIFFCTLVIVFLLSCGSTIFFPVPHKNSFSSPMSFQHPDKHNPMYVAPVFRAFFFRSLEVVLWAHHYFVGLLGNFFPFKLALSRFSPNGFGGFFPRFHA